MSSITEYLQPAAFILGICILMIYPYLGAGVLLALICFKAEQYLLMAVCIAVCIALHVIMGKKIKPVRGAVPPSQASRRKKRKAEAKAAEAAKIGKDVKTQTSEEAERPEKPSAPR